MTFMELYHTCENFGPNTEFHIFDRNDWHIGNFEHLGQFDESPVITFKILITGQGYIQFVEVYV